MFDRVMISQYLYTLKIRRRNKWDNPIPERISYSNRE